MIQSRRVPLVLLLLAIAGSALYLANREPSYKGRSLSSWLKDLNEDEEGGREPHEAIRQIGTKALPYLLQELRCKDSAAKLRLMSLNNQLEARLDRELMKFTPALNRRFAAAEAFRALGSNGAPAIAELCRNLTDKELTLTSAEALALIGEPALPAIKNLALSTNASARWACAYDLQQFTNANDNVPILQKLAADVDWVVRAVAAHALGYLAAAPETSVPILITLLNDTNTTVQRAACVGLGAFGTNAVPALPALGQIAADVTADFNIRNAATIALWRIGPASIPIFLKLLSHPDPRIRSLAVRHLSSFKEEMPHHVAALIPLLHDPDERVRLSVLLDLREDFSGRDQFLPPLLEALKLETDENIRGHYLITLQKFGPSATNTLPTLIELAGQSQGDARTTLLLTIATIDEDAAKKLGAEPWLLEAAKNTLLKIPYRLTGSTPTNGQPPPPISVPPPSP